MNFLAVKPSSFAEPRHAEHSLSEYVCWTRMQAEAGQHLDAIIARKELERQAGEGHFMWGVGNAPSVAISPLARIGRQVPVVFSIMKGRPKQADIAPRRLVAWARYFDSTGLERTLPLNSIVTSRGDTAFGAKQRHYALMCFSRSPLRLEREVPFDVTAFRNVSSVGAPIGASQVTALLRQVSEPSSTSDYEVNLRAWLAHSYWVRLSEPVEVTAELAKRLAAASSLDVAGWLELASDFRRQKRRGADQRREPTLI